MIGGGRGRAEQAGRRAHDLPRQPDARVLRRRPGSRCTATSTAPATCWPALVERPRPPDDELPSAGRADHRHVVRRGAGAVRRRRRRLRARPRRARSLDGSRTALAAAGDVVPGRAQGARSAAQVRRAAASCSGSRTGRGARRRTRPGGAPRPAGRLGRGDGRPRRGRRADRRLRPRPHASDRCVMVGLGGVFAEVLGDTALRARPGRRATARGRLLLSLRGAPLLHRRPGPRAGRPRRARRR